MASSSDDVDCDVVITSWADADVLRHLLYWG